EACEDAQERRLPGAVLAHDADPRGLVDLEVEAVQDRAGAERLHGAPERDQRRHRAGTVPAGVGCRPVEKTRMDAFSDGVFAIAITLLVLDLHVPEVGDGSLTHALGRQWPADASYAVSFLTIGIIWINHHGLFRHIERCDRVLLSLNIFLLMMIAVVPYP